MRGQHRKNARRQSAIERVKRNIHDYQTRITRESDDDIKKAYAILVKKAQITLENTVAKMEHK
jgi:hypothetical protein